jgi:hypothetical protein
VVVHFGALVGVVPCKFLKKNYAIFSSVSKGYLTKGKKLACLMKSVMPVEVGIMLFIKPVSFFSHDTRYLMGTP